jgi:hypothetical protein
MFEESEDGKWYRVSLRLMGDGLPIDEIDGLLGLAATKKNKKGASLKIGKAKCLTNVWVLSSGHNSDVPFEKQIADLLDLIEPKRDALKRIIEMADVEGELFLGYGSDNGQGGALISADVLRRIADCGLSLDLDLYPPPGEEED